MKIYASRKNDIKSQLRKFAEKDIWVKVDIDDSPRYIKILKMYTPADGITRMCVNTINSTTLISLMNYGRVNSANTIERKLNDPYEDRRTIPVYWIKKFYGQVYTEAEIREMIAEAYEKADRNN